MRQPRRLTPYLAILAIILSVITMTLKIRRLGLEYMLYVAVGMFCVLVIAVSVVYLVDRR